MYKVTDHHKKSKHRKTKRRCRDLDEIDNDLKPENAAKLLNQEIDFDKPGNGQFYCLHCARYFINAEALHQHTRTKVHKRRLKELEEEPYTIEESERAGGMGSYIPPKKRKITTLLPGVEKKEPTLDDDDVNMKEVKIDQ